MQKQQLHQLQIYFTTFLLTPVTLWCLETFNQAAPQSKQQSCHLLSPEAFNCNCFYSLNSNVKQGSCLCIQAVPQYHLL